MDIALDSALPLDVAVTEFLEQQALALPARSIAAVDDSGLVTPPDGHVLDALVHQHMLVDTDEFTWGALGTVAVMATLPACDSCGEPARYDVISPLPACWSCEGCFEGTLLGMGRAQRLVRYHEVSPDVRALCDQLTEVMDRASIFD